MPKPAQYNPNHGGNRRPVGQLMPLGNVSSVGIRRGGEEDQDTPLSQNTEKQDSQLFMGRTIDGQPLMGFVLACISLLVEK